MKDHENLWETDAFNAPESLPSRWGFHFFLLKISTPRLTSILGGLLPNNELEVPFDPKLSQRKSRLVATELNHPKSRGVDRGIQGSVLGCCS